MRVRTDESGLAAIVLVIVIAWALAAVLMLTGTLLSAREIDDRVVAITGEVSEIDQDLDAIMLTEETNRIAGGILAAAQPLDVRLSEVIEAARGIDGNVSSILQNATAINATAKDINSTVQSIRGNAASINDSVKSIGGTVDSIHGNLGAILSTVRSIDKGVEGINQRADTIIQRVRGIESDTSNILAHVGVEHGTATRTIHGHANSINCNPAVVAASAEGTQCGQ
ncbi:MAG TPA: hypothetical protein VHF25_16550 [Nitriliruptorales bacterium]|nr:hypothetical protein [Nitriliruptorales bacterium]